MMIKKIFLMTLATLSLALSACQNKKNTEELPRPTPAESSPTGSTETPAPESQMGLDDIIPDTETKKESESTTPKDKSR